MTETVGPMFNPPHPGEFITSAYLVPLDISARTLASACGVAVTSVTRILNGEARVTPEMAVRLEKALGRSAKSWLNMQNNYDLWHIGDSVNLDALAKIPALV